VATNLSELSNLSNRKVADWIYIISVVQVTNFKLTKKKPFPVKVNLTVDSEMCIRKILFCEREIV